MAGNWKNIETQYIFENDLVIAAIMVFICHKIDIFTRTHGKLYFFLLLALYLFICGIVYIIMPVSKAIKHKAWY